MSAPSASSNPSSARTAVDGYSSENERSRSPLPIIHRVSNSSVVPAESSLPFFTYEPSVLDIDNLLMMPPELHRTYESLTEARENEAAFSPLFEGDSLNILFEEDSVDLLLEGDSLELRQSILRGVRELYTFDREVPVSNTALLSFNAADSGEGTSGAASALENMQQVGCLPLQLDCPLFTNQLDQVTRNAPSSSAAVLASKLSLPSNLVCSAAPTFDFEFDSALASALMSASALVSASRSKSPLRIKNVSLTFKQALKRNETVYLVFDFSKGALTYPCFLRVRLLSLKMGDQKFFTETVSVYKRCRELIVSIPEEQCSMNDNCVFDILFFSCSHEKIHNLCYQMRSTFALTNITSINWNPVAPNRYCSEGGRIKKFFPQ